MKTYLFFKTKELVKKINSPTEFYEVKNNNVNLLIKKSYKNKRGRPFSVNLPKIIKISPEAAGLFVGEGYLGRGCIVFANSNERAIDIMIEFLKQFNIPLKFYLEISTKGESNDLLKKCKIFWEKHLGIKLNRIRLREEFYNSGNLGTVHISIFNSLLSKLLKQLINLSKKKAEKNKEIAIGYLKGIIAAEGNINVKKSTNCVYMVRISASKPEEREHYKRCLERAGINIHCEDMPTISPEEGIKKGWKTTKGRAGAVIISRWDNFVKIFELNLLELDKNKKDKFIKYFVNNQFTKQFLDFEKFIGGEFTMKEAQNLFGFKGRHLSRILTLMSKGYISRRKLNQVKFAYKLTKKYHSLYNKLKTI